MIKSMTHLPRHVLVGCIGLLIALILAGSYVLLILPRVSSHAFAVSLQQLEGATCALAPTMEHCNHQDPELQGCAADARTLGLPAAIVENGFTIGSVERRYSLKCQAWWGRLSATRMGSQTTMSITIAGTTLSAAPTFVSNHVRVLYSSMIFDATATQPVPAITGTLKMAGMTPAAAATLPAIPALGN